MPRNLSGYQAIISKATGATDRKVLEEIEDIMRHDVFHSTLDWQTRAQLERGAKLAHAVMKNRKGGT